MGHSLCSVVLSQLLVANRCWFEAQKTFKLSTWSWVDGRENMPPLMNILNQQNDRIEYNLFVTFSFHHVFVGWDPNERISIDDVVGAAIAHWGKGASLVLIKLTPILFPCVFDIAPMRYIFSSSHVHVFILDIDSFWGPAAGTGVPRWTAPAIQCTVQPSEVCLVHSTL